MTRIKTNTFCQLLLAAIISLPCIMSTGCNKISRVNSISINIDNSNVSNSYVDKTAKQIVEEEPYENIKNVWCKFAF